MNKDDLKKYGRKTLIIFSIAEVFAILGCFPIFHDSEHLLPLFWMFTGFWISIGLGTPSIGKSREFFAKNIKESLRGKVLSELGWERIPELDKDLPSSHIDWLLGVIERIIFTVFVAISAKSAIAPIGGWIALKLAASWRTQ